MTPGSISGMGPDILAEFQMLETTNVDDECCVKSFEEREDADVMKQGCRIYDTRELS